MGAQTSKPYVDNLSGGPLVLPFPVTEIAAGESVNMYWESPSDGTITLEALGSIGSGGDAEAIVSWDSTDQKVSTSTRESVEIDIPNSKQVLLKLNNPTTSTISCSAYFEIGVS